MNNKKATITKLLNEGINVAIIWDQEAINMFRTIEKRFWCSMNKLWSFPAKDIDTITEELKKLNYEVEIKDYKPSVCIRETNNTHFEVSSEFNPTIHDIIRQVPNRSWDPSKIVWRIPNEHLNLFVETLDKNGINYTITSNHGFDFVDAAPLKTTTEPLPKQQGKRSFIKKGIQYTLDPH